MEWEIVEEVLSKGETVQVRVKGVSMYPHYFTGDLLLLEPTSNAQKGKCYLAARGNQYRIHRCLNVEPQEFQGDNLDEADAMPDRILALVANRKFTLESILKRVYYFFAKLI